MTTDLSSLCRLLHPGVPKPAAEKRREKVKYAPFLISQFKMNSWDMIQNKITHLSTKASSLPVPKSVLQPEPWTSRCYITAQSFGVDYVFRVWVAWVGFGGLGYGLGAWGLASGGADEGLG